MKYMGFQIVFNISKIKQTLQIDWPNTFLPTTWEREVLKKCFWQNHKGNYGASFNTQKSTYWWINFFQNPYCWFILEHSWTSLTKPTTLSREMTDMPDMPDHTKMVKLQQKANSLPQIVFEILKFKKFYNLIGLEYFQLQLKD